VSAPRRRAAGWLLLGSAALAVAMGSGALAVAMPSPVFDVVTTGGYLAMLGAVTRALATDPGAGAATQDGPGDVPLTGVVVRYCLSSGVVLLVFGSWALGRPVAVGQVLTVALLMLLTFVRTLVWVAQGARLTRQVVRTEAWFRALVHQAADLTVVLDAQGRIAWTSVEDTGPETWTARDLEGRLLADFVHPDDRDEFARALEPFADADADADAECGPVFRLRSRGGSWRQFETLRTSSSAAVPGTPTGDLAHAARGGLVLHLRDLAGRRSAERKLERMAYTDFLTGLPNRARLMSALEAARTRAAAGEPSCVLLIDLDGFKAVNDVAGHEAGDRLLCEVADALRRGARDRDLVARLGGDEFALVVPGGPGEAIGLAERLVGLLDRSFRVPTATGEGTGPVFAVSGSIGVAELQPAEAVSAAIRQADLALRAAKAAGKNCVRSAGPAGDGIADEAMRRRSQLARDLPAAIERGMLELEYQPVVGLAERRVLGLEALVRWRHPQLGTVPPEEFIHLAEDDGLIVALQRWVLGAATAALAPLLAEGRDLQLGVNISVRHLQAGCLAPDVARALAASGVPPHRLMVEITESVLMGAEDAVGADLVTLREMGCILSLDDFGRGYSSLARLARLPVDVLKMDRDFVADIERDPRAAALVGTVVELGHILGMDVVAEGVETAGQMAALRRLGCRFLQGYLLGRPVAAAELPAVLDGFDAGLLDGGADPTDAPAAVHLVGRPS
jgi:diguanylate cyclase (GGDEF)-like protein